MSDVEYRLDDIIEEVDYDEDLGKVPTKEDVELGRDEEPDEELKAELGLSGDDDEEEPSEETPAEGADSEEGDEDELVEVEWYGRRGKISKGINDFMNKFFTETRQREAAEKRRFEQEAQSRIDEANRQVEEARELQAQLQAHLDRNPQLRQAFDDDTSNLAEIKRNRELFERTEKLERMLEERRVEQERAEADRILSNTLNDLKSRYKLAPNSPLEMSDIENLALGRVIASNYNLQLEDVWQEEVAKANSRARKQRTGYIKDKQRVAKQAPVEGKRTGSGKQATKVNIKEMSLDQLLDHHMKTL